MDRLTTKDLHRIEQEAIESGTARGSDMIDLVAEVRMLHRENSDLRRCNEVSQVAVDRVASLVQQRDQARALLEITCQRLVDALADPEHGGAAPFPGTSSYGCPLCPAVWDAHRTCRHRDRVEAAWTKIHHSTAIG